MFRCNLYRTLQLFTNGDFDAGSFQRVIAGYLSTFLGHRKADLYCFYFHRKCPERPERCLYIYIYIYIYINSMADTKSVRNLSAIFR